MRARARVWRLIPPERISRRPILAWRPVARVPLKRRETRPAGPTRRGGQRSGRLHLATSLMAPTTPTQTLCRGVHRGRGRQARCCRRVRRRRRIPTPPWTCKFSSPQVGAKDRPRPWRRSEGQPPSSRQRNATVRAAGRSGVAPKSVGTKRAAPEQGLSGRPVKKSRVHSKM
jgi:hypothetical protein